MHYVKKKHVVLRQTPVRVLPVNMSASPGLMLRYYSKVRNQLLGDTQALGSCLTGGDQQVACKASNSNQVGE